jgi:hypothetical protein
MDGPEPQTPPKGVRPGPAVWPGFTSGSRLGGTPACDSDPAALVPCSARVHWVRPPNHRGHGGAKLRLAIFFEDRVRRFTAPLNARPRPFSASHHAALKFAPRTGTRLSVWDDCAGKKNCQLWRLYCGEISPHTFIQHAYYFKLKIYCSGQHKGN